MSPAPPLRGDEAELYELHAERLLGQVRAAVFASETIIEDACAFAWAQLLAYQPARDNVFAWLRTTALREAWRESARERREPTGLLESATDHDGRVEGSGPQPEETVIAREAVRAIRRLAPRRRRILELHVAGYSYAEIEAMTGDGWRVIDRQLRRARNQLEGRGAKQRRRRA